MPLIKSISGIRGTIGGRAGDNLTPVDIVDCTAGFGTWLLNLGGHKKIVVGRDGRLSGAMVSQMSIQTLLAMGIDVVDLGLSTTPTVEMAVTRLKAGAGIIFTASHNPKEWNALKFLNEKGEFISAQDGEDILKIIDDGAMSFVGVEETGRYSTYENHIEDHIQAILGLPEVLPEKIKAVGYHVVVDCINSTGALALPPLLDALGVTYSLIHAGDFGNFAHNPEPLPAHLQDLCQAVIREKATLGISVDPDVDRLAFVCEDGSLFGEEYTLVAIADYFLSGNPGRYAVSNLSSSRALADIARKNGGFYRASAVGEVNVVTLIKETNAIIGGEGNGGIIVPGLHYGRDAMAGIALFLSYLALSGKKLTEVKKGFPDYVIIKDKIALENDAQVERLKSQLLTAFANEKINTIDGIKIDFEEGWVHLRKSNTEPIVRIYAESHSQSQAESLINRVKSQIS